MAELTPGALGAALGSKENLVLKFYAPWCGHCQALTPAWDALLQDGVPGARVHAVNVEQEGLADVRLTDGTPVGTKVGAGVPTILFVDGATGATSTFDGTRTTEAIRAGASQFFGGLRGGGAPALAWGADDLAAHLTHGTPAVVKFHAPWCGHCQALAPEWDKLAAGGIDDVTVASVDVQRHDMAEVVTPTGTPVNDVRGRGVPAIVFFQGDRTHAYEGPRTADAIGAAARTWFTGPSLRGGGRQETTLQPETLDAAAFRDLVQHGGRRAAVAFHRGGDDAPMDLRRLVEQGLGPDTLVGRVDQRAEKVALKGVVLPDGRALTTVVRRTPTVLFLDGRGNVETYTPGPTPLRTAASTFLHGGGRPDAGKELDAQLQKLQQRHDAMERVSATGLPDKISKGEAEVAALKTALDAQREDMRTKEMALQRDRDELHRVRSVEEKNRVEERLIAEQKTELLALKAEWDAAQKLFDEKTAHIQDRFLKNDLGRRALQGGGLWARLFGGDGGVEHSGGMSNKEKRAEVERVAKSEATRLRLQTANCPDADAIADLVADGKGVEAEEALLKWNAEERAKTVAPMLTVIDGGPHEYNKLKTDSKRKIHVSKWQCRQVLGILNYMYMLPNEDTTSDRDEKSRLHGMIKKIQALVQRKGPGAEAIVVPNAIYSMILTGIDKAVEEEDKAVEEDDESMLTVIDGGEAIDGKLNKEDSQTKILVSKAHCAQVLGMLNIMIAAHNRAQQSAAGSDPYIGTRRDVYVHASTLRETIRAFVQTKGPGAQEISVPTDLYSIVLRAIGKAVEEDKEVTTSEDVFLKPRTLPPPAPAASAAPAGPQRLQDLQRQMKKMKTRLWTVHLQSQERTLQHLHLPLLLLGHPVVLLLLLRRCRHNGQIGPGRGKGIRGLHRLFGQVGVHLHPLFIPSSNI